MKTKLSVMVASFLAVFVFAAVFAVAVPQGTVFAQQEQAVEEDEEPGEVKCEKSSNAGWIICPVITGGIDLTDTIYAEIVEPLLEDVPIANDQNSGAYIAWQQFRLIGNILLIGTLLAVVYSQARGGK